MRSAPKLTGLVLTLLMGLAACGEKQATQENTPSGQQKQEDVRVYGVKAGRIDFEITGFQTGSATTYWDGWGMREVERSDVQIDSGDRSVVLKHLALRTADGLIIADLSSNLATRRPNPIFQFLEEKGLTGGENLGEKWIEGMGGVRDGTDTVAGQECDVWVVEQLRGKLCIWKGLMLRQEVKMEGATFSKTAVRIDTETPVDPALFEQPPGLNFSEEAQPGEPPPTP